MTMPFWARRQASLLYLFILIAVASSYAQAAWSSLLRPKRFRYQGLIDAGTLGLYDVGSGIVAWGDWNGDQYLDAFTLSDDRKTLYLTLWDHADFAFSSHPLLAISPASGDPIVNVVPADYDKDGRLDVLVMTQAAKSGELKMEVWLGRGVQEGAIAAKPLQVPSSTTAQPLIVDATGDMEMDLLGLPFDTSSSPSSLALWRNSFAASNRTTAFEVQRGPFLQSPWGEEPCQLADPHSSAFVDLDGDCLADLFLVCAPSTKGGRQRYQIWTAVKPTDKDAGGFAFSRSGQLPQGAGPLSFADMNRDGTTDVVFASCDSKDCYVNVVYNQQMALCDKKAAAAGGAAFDKTQGWADWLVGGHYADGGQDKGRCRRTEALCVADDQFAFDFDGKNGTKALLQVPFSALLPGHKPLFVDALTANSATPQPVPLVVGDYDKNGYPDLVLLSIPPGQPSDGTGKTAVNVLRNARCSDVSGKVKEAQAACKQDNEARWFSVVTEGAEILANIDDARAASWVDVDEDGSLDLMLLRGRRQDGGVRSVTFIQNNYFHDAFFLKALTLNGACSSFCEPAQGSRFRPWGAFLPGASYKFTVLDPNGNRRAQQVGQCSQSSYRPLLTPYSYFGLGRTNNYVESMLVGSTLHAPRHFLAMEGVIPNSQVIISPYVESMDDVDPARWKRELYLQPGDWIPAVTATLVTLIIALCGFVYFRHQQERRQDELERKKGVMALNFDAL